MSMIIERELWYVLVGIVTDGNDADGNPVELLYCDDFS